MDELRIDPEFEELLDGLTTEQEAELVSLLEQEGWRKNERIYVWANHDNTIIDGHNRYRICQRLGISFRTEALTFATRDDVKKWIYRNQAGRRNLTPQQLRYIRGKVYEAEEKTPGKRTDLTSDQSDRRLTPVKKIAKDFNVGEATIRRDAAFAAKVDAEVAKVIDPKQKAAKKAELLGNKDGRKNKNKGKTMDAAKKNGKKVDLPALWQKTLAEADGKEVTNEWFADRIGCKPTHVTHILSAMERCSGFVVEAVGPGKRRVDKVATFRTADIESKDLSLLSAVKAVVEKAIMLHERSIEGIDFHLVWNALREVQKLLKDVPAAQTHKSK